MSKETMIEQEWLIKDLSEMGGANWKEGWGG